MPPVPKKQRPSYYDRLLHQCRKDLHKQAKLVRTFLVRKQMRQSAETNTEQLSAWKALDLDPVVNEALRRLGVEGFSALAADDDEQSRRMERILQHKKLRDSLERWSDEWTKYRRWQTGGGSRERDEKKSATAVKQLAVSSSASLFVQLGEEEDDTTTAATAEQSANSTKQRKNRPGQRARRAQREAQENGGGTRANWRTKPNEEQPAAQATAAAPSSNDDENNDLHPSWQARKQQATTAVFSGTRITF